MAKFLRPPSLEYDASQTLELCCNGVAYSRDGARDLSTPSMLYTAGSPSFLHLRILGNDCTRVDDPQLTMLEAETCVIDRVGRLVSCGHNIGCSRVFVRHLLRI